MHHIKPIGAQHTRFLVLGLGAGVLSVCRTSITFLFSHVLNLFGREGGLAELASGAATTWWGIIMLSEKVQADWYSVDIIQKFLPHRYLGGIAIVLGLGQVFAFGMIDKKWKWPVVSLGAAVLLQCLWGINLISACYLSWSIAPPSASIFGMWIINFYLIIRFVVIARDGSSG